MNILRSIFVMLTTLSLSGCGPHYVDYFPYHDDGTIKPHVAVLPVSNCLRRPLPIDAARDMNCSIDYALMDSGLLYVLPPEEVEAGLARLGKIDFFNSDCALMEHYCNSDFIVLTELFDYNVLGCSGSGVAQLEFKARIKVIDTRCKAPRLALQEVMTRAYSICAFPGVGETENEHYTESVYKANLWFAGAVAKRLEEVILSAH